MAYNNYFPATYQPMGYYGQPGAYQYQQAQQQLMQQQAQAQAQQQQPQIQQSGFVLVRSEDEAKAYPVAPGNSVTFKDETAPFCYVKTMGFNSLDRPTFERYRLVKEDMPQDAQKEAKTSESGEGDSYPAYVLKSEFEALRDEVEALKAKGESHDDE